MVLNDVKYIDNHYHLLLKTSVLNLSLHMRQVNSRYSLYFNKKYKRVSPLWQERFKSWYAYDEKYLKNFRLFYLLMTVLTNEIFFS